MLSKFNKDVCAGVLFIAFAALFGASSLNLAAGTAVRMGPGYFPRVLCGVLALLGVVILLNGLRGASSGISKIEWRGLILITAAVIAFGMLVQPLGFLPALTVTMVITLFASKFIRPVSGLVLTVTVVTFCWAVFIWGIKLPWPLIGPWLGGY